MQNKQFDTSLASLRQTFHPLGQPPQPKQFLITDQYAFNLVYGDPIFKGGPNPENYLIQLESERMPELLLFPQHHSLSKPQPHQSVPVVSVEDNDDAQMQQQNENQNTDTDKSSNYQIAIVDSQKQVNALVKKNDEVELLQYRNPHLLSPSTFNIQNKNFYYNNAGTLVRPYAFADIKFKRPCFYETTKQFRECYNLGIPLGSGSTSCVRRCENRERANSKCAKMINIDCNRELLNEFNILKKIYHPLIVDVQEVIEESKKLYLIEEICMGGDVAHILAGRPSFSEEDAAYIVKGALIAIAYCHQRQIIHRNIKPANFVFKKTGSKMAKLIDFGSAVDLSSKYQKETLPLQKIVGQPCYMSPEMLKECYNEKVDIWSLGVMMYELLSNKLPFDASSDQEIMLSIVDGSFSFSGPSWRVVREEGKDLIKQMLNYNPNNRISALKALKHPWIVTLAPFRPDAKIINELLNSMVDCKIQNKVQEAILSMICHRSMNREDMENIEYAFLCLDTDFDGYISFEELSKAFEEYYQDPFGEDESFSDDDEEATTRIREQKRLDIDLIFTRCDLDGDGMIDWHDFLLTACNKYRTLSKYNLDEAFYSFDLYQKNFVTYDDFECAFGKFDQLGTNVWEDMIAQATENEEGLLSMEDFHHMMLQMLKA